MRRLALMAGRSVNNRSRIVVIADELCVGGLELADEIVHFLVQRQVRCIELAAQLVGRSLASGTRLSRRFDDCLVSGDCLLQCRDFCRSHAVVGEIRHIRVGRVMDLLALFGGSRVAPSDKVGEREVNQRSQLVVFYFDRVSTDGGCDAHRRVAHGFTQLLFVLRDSARALRLRLSQTLDVLQMRAEVRVAIGERLQGLPSRLVGISKQPSPPDTSRVCLIECWS